MLQLVESFIHVKCCEWMSMAYSLQIGLHQRTSKGSQVCPMGVARTSTPDLCTLVEKELGTHDCTGSC